jgi:hypothetical protein
MKPVYLFSDVDGEYKGEYLAQESPLDLGVFITPVYSTDVAPPVTANNEVAVFVSNAWRITPDFRGRTIYNKITGAAHDVTEFGTIPSGFSFVPAPPTLSESAKTKRTKLTQSYQAAIQQNVAYSGTTFQADTASQQALTAALAAGAVPAGFAWLDANNVWVPMTYAQLQGLAGVMLAQGFTAFQRLQTRKTATRAALTVEEVDAVIAAPFVQAAAL